MAILAADVVNTARDEHPAFDRQSTPDIVALRALARYQQELLGRIYNVKPDAVHVAQEVQIPLEDFAAGIALNDCLQVHGASVYYRPPDRRQEPVMFVDYPHRFIRPGGPAAYRRADRICLLGTPEEWKDAERIVIDLFPRGPDTLGPKDELVLPGQALAPCVAALAVVMARRVEPDRRPDLIELRDRLAEAEERYLDQVTGRRRAVVSVIQDVW